VDLPTFGRPARHAKPDRKTGAAGPGLACLLLPRARPVFFSVTRGWFTHQLSGIRVTCLGAGHKAACGGGRRLRAETVPVAAGWRLAAGLTARTAQGADEPDHGGCSGCKRDG
jgi:hypothetical protein